MSDTAEERQIVGMAVATFVTLMLFIYTRIVYKAPMYAVYLAGVLIALPLEEIVVATFLISILGYKASQRQAPLSKRGKS